MLKYIFIFWIYCSVASLIVGQPSDIHFSGKEKYELINSRETNNSIVSLVLIDGVMYLVKQKKEPRKRLAVVRDALAAYIAKDLNIAQQIVIVAYQKEIPGKTKANLPATIHTLASGNTVREQNSYYKGLRLKQLWARAKNSHERGFTRDIIIHMTWHKDLPIIVALDLIIGNSDRHSGNICYDPLTDRFFAIDMDDTFNKDLCLCAYKKIKPMLENDDIIFTAEEIDALISMQNTLRFLVKRHTPHHLINKLYCFVRQAGFYRGDNPLTDKEIRSLIYYEKMITQSYVSAKKLIKLLDKIIIRKLHILETIHS